jgi:micrococcal nuclease
MLSFMNRVCSGICSQNSSTKEYFDIKWSDTKPFVPPINSGYVIKVYDGDSFTIASEMPFINSPIYRFSVRLSGIDCPEIKGKTIIEKELAINARDALANKIMNKTITLKNVSLEKYGRILADVYCDGVHINQWMLDNKFALPYDGGTKVSEWI